MKKPWVIPHKGADIVSIRKEGKHIDYVCYFHAPRLIAILEDGNDDPSIQQWGVPSEHQQKKECCFNDK